MNDGTTLARVLAVMGDQLNLPAETLQADKPLGEQEFDSLDTIELAMELEDHFGISLGDDDADQIELTHTPSQVAARVDAELTRRGAAPPAEAL